MKEYSLTQDTLSVLSKINQQTDLNGDFRIEGEAYRYLTNLCRILQQITPKDVEVITYSEEKIENLLSGRVRQYLTTNQEAVAILLDRFILNTLQTDEQLGRRLFRFSMCRNINGNRIPRQGEEDFEAQFVKLQQLFPNITKRPVVLVDDGLFTGGTINKFMELADNYGVDLNVQKIFGFLGDGGARQFSQAEIIKSIPNLYEWVDLRDFGIFGGKQLARGKANKVTSAIPYLYPWSKGEGASLEMSPQLFSASKDMIREFIELINSYQEKTGKTLTFRDLIKAGYPLPTDIERTIPITINTCLSTYLQSAIKLIDKESQRPVIVLDMDGTLYELNGQDGSFKGSSLERAVFNNALRFIIEREGVTSEQALEIMKTGQEDEVGISCFLSRRYNISREEYFNSVWSINPEGMVSSFEGIENVFKIVKETKPEVKLILLTSAPRVWATRVLEYLGITNYFEEIYTGENYGKKKDIFEIIGTRYHKATSIGDQMETDIVPAQEWGMRGIKVNGPEEILGAITQGLWEK